MQKLPKEIFPEYFIIRVNEFNSVARTPLEEWISYLKTGVIKPDASAPGLQEAREKLKYYNMTDAERRAYDEHLSAIMIQNDLLSTTKLEGHEEGRKEGLAEGLEKGMEKGLEKGLAEGEKKALLNTARQMKADGLPAEVIARYTHLTEEEIASL